MARKLFALSVLLLMTAAPALARTGTVHVLFSDLNAAKYPNVESERIEGQLASGGFDVRRIGDRDLTAMNGVTANDVVVMCGVYLMNDDTIAALTKFARQGGGVLWIDAPTPAVINQEAMRKLLGVSILTTYWKANFAEIMSGRPTLYKHFINGDHEFFTAVECGGNSAWAVAGAYELGKFPPIQNKEWHVVDRTPVRGPGILDRIPALTENMLGKGRVVLFNWKAELYGGSDALDMIRRATAWLLADGDEAAANAILAGRHGIGKRMPSEMLPAIEAVGEPKTEPLGEPKDFRLPMGLFIRSDDFGLVKVGDARPEPMKEWPLFQKMMGNIKSVGAHSVYMYPFTEPEGTALWPSKILRNHADRDLLKEFCDAMHEQGIKVETYTDEPDPYFWPNPDDPATSKTRCVWDLAPKWANFNNELTDRPLDGLCVPPDEYQRPAYNGKPTDDNECVKRFKKETGFDMPTGDPVDTPQWRAWINYEYAATAEVFAGWNNLLARKDPKLERTNIIFVGELCWKSKAPINWGLTGHAADWSALMTDPYVGLHTDLLNHWYVAETVKRLMAGTSSRQAMVTLQNNRLREFNEQLRPQHVYGEAVSSIAHGGRGVHFFHYFKIFDTQGEPFLGRVERTVQANSLLRTLDKWGVMDGQVPQEIVLLFGQMSQDYAWLIKNKYLGNGYEAQQAAMDMLLANGYPFEVYNLDQEADWAKLPKSTKVVIVPFAYAISDKAVEQLEAHARAGRKIILMQRMGEADMKGDVRESPALGGLLANYPDSVVRLEGDVMMGKVTPDYVARYCQAIDSALGDAKLVNLDRCGQDIEATCLNLKDGRKILFAINWEKKPAAFELGVNLPAGQYRLTERNLQGTQPAALKGGETIDGRDLRRFVVNLDTEELRFWLIEPAN